MSSVAPLPSKEVTWARICLAVVSRDLGDRELGQQDDHTDLDREWTSDILL